MSVFIKTIGNLDDHKPTLTLLHGWGLNGAVWDSVCEPLAAHCRLHIVDLPGHGFSKDDSLTTLDAAADLIADALQCILPTSKQTHLLGWSLGGQIALTIARRKPALIDRLILTSTTPCFVTRDDWPHGKKIEVLDDFAARLANNYATTIRGFLALQTLHQPAARASVAALLAAMSARGEPSANSLQAGLNILRSTDMREQLEGVAHRTIVVQGDHDALTTEPAARWLSQRLPNADYKLIEHAAHAPFLSHRELFLSHVVNHLKT